MRVSTDRLLSLLPTLALVGLALTAVEDVPSAIAHNRRHPDHPRHLVQRQNLAVNVGAQEKKRGEVRRNSDGSQCRVKSSASSAFSSSITSSSKAAPFSTSTTEASKSTESAHSDTTSESATTPTSFVNADHKFGLAWPNGDYTSPGDPGYIGNYIGKRASSYYTWSASNVKSADKLGLAFMPMLWCGDKQSDFQAQQKNWPKTIKHALFFNEPNQDGQCNTAAGDAVSYWMNDFVPLRSRGIKLGSAATTSAPSGLSWVLDMIQDCENDGNSKADCTPDFAAIHWYDVSIDGFQAYVKNFHEKTGLDIMITEYACQNFNGGAQCSYDQTWQLHTTMAEWFDQQDYVIGYHPFGVMKNMQGVNQDNALMNTDGSITQLGNYVCSYL
ncbi:glycosyl hydrolase catalytic core-domain-containing protein [Naematelia encephala]|uniref:Glycosyl hydrolase catalytic core-domain-containing protein n=1 Tax=Naematelia encephala TaxID=71784 RepID=A0A1Y2AR90_9TREE|nr:glycosyl hydrolase catalytic core-domain-containing protein [Naematelia encephala]